MPPLEILFYDSEERKVQAGMFCGQFKPVGGKYGEELVRSELTFLPE